MEDTQVGRDLIEIGIEKGIEKGFLKGIEKGIEQGIEKGIEKGIEQGIKKGKHQLVLSLLLHKFDTLPEDLINRTQTIQDDTKLEEIALKTGELTSLNQLKELLN